MGCGCGRKFSQSVQSAPQSRQVAGAGPAQRQAQQFSQAAARNSQTVEVPYNGGRSGRQTFIRKTV